MFASFLELKILLSTFSFTLKITVFDLGPIIFYDRYITTNPIIKCNNKTLDIEE